MTSLKLSIFLLMPEPTFFQDKWYLIIAALTLFYTFLDQVRKVSKKEEEPPQYSTVPSEPASRKISQNPGYSAVGERKENADFQFSMLKASLDYDTEIFGSNVSQHVIENNPLSRNISTLSDPAVNNNLDSNDDKPNALESFKRKSKKEKLQNCNSPGAMLAYAQYTQEGGFVPECIRRPEIGLDLEIFNVNAVSDIQERMATFNEVHFYDGTLNTNLTLEEAHENIIKMRNGVKKKADKVRKLPGSSYSGGPSVSGSGSSGISLSERRKLARKAKTRRQSSVSTLQAGMLFNGILESGSNGSSSSSSGYGGSQMGMIMEEMSETGDTISNIDDLETPVEDSTNSTAMPNMIEEQGEPVQGVGAVDMFIDDANPLNRVVHSSLGNKNYSTKIIK